MILGSQYRAIDRYIAIKYDHARSRRQPNGVGIQMCRLMLLSHSLYAEF